MNTENKMTTKLSQQKKEQFSTQKTSLFKNNGNHTYYNRVEINLKATKQKQEQIKFIKKWQMKMAI